jgi:hypothetical protein
VGGLRACWSRAGVSVAGALVRTPHDAGSELIPTLVRRALATVQRTGSTKTHTQARVVRPGVRSYGRSDAGRVQGAGCRVQGAGCRVQGAGCEGARVLRASRVVCLAHWHATHGGEAADTQLAQRAIWGHF